VAALYFQLLQNVVDMVLHRIGSNAQLAGDLFVTEAGAHQLQNFRLSVCELGAGSGITLPGQPTDIAQNQLRHTGGRHCLVIVHHLYGPDQVGERLGAEHMRVHPGLDVADDVGIADLRTQENKLRPGELSASIIYHLEYGFLSTGGEDQYHIDRTIGVELNLGEL